MEAEEGLMEAVIMVDGVLLGGIPADMVIDITEAVITVVHSTVAQLFLFRFTTGQIIATFLCSVMTLA